MYENIKNKIVSNVIDKNIEKNIYDLINSADKKSEHVVSVFGQSTFFINYDLVKYDIEKIIQKYFDKTIEIKELAFAKYHHDSGFVPKLFPHFDHFDEHRITFDLQIKSNIKWPLVIEGKNFVLNDNEALIFSGTDQIHWRSNFVFGKNDFVDMLFVHLVEKDSVVLISEEFKNKRQQKWETFKDYPGLNYNPTVSNHKKQEYGII